MRFKALVLVSLYLFTGMAQAALKTDVEYLSSETLEGRLTGTKGEKLATEYAAQRFKQIGLVPAGDNGSYFQAFPVSAGAQLGENNFLFIIDRNKIKKTLKMNQDWRPLSFSDTTSFNVKELILAGYGITAPATDNLSAYDSYKNLNVKNKWVVIFKDLPEKISEERSQQLYPYSALRYKIFTAKNHGAIGIIFINRNNGLIPFASSAPLSGSGIAVITIKENVLNTLLKDNKSEFKQLQDELDTGKLPTLPIINNIKMLGKTEIKQTTKYGHNVLAKLNCGSNPTGTIIISAHIDHLGHGELGGARGHKNGKIYPGADDNASGVATILEVATKLNTYKSFCNNKDILFAAWSGEELGDLGSSYFIKNLSNTESGKIVANINLDMVGHLQDKLIIQGIGSSNDWVTFINKSNQNPSIQLKMQNDPYLPTDSTAFYVHGIPSINLFTGANDSYHTPEDSPQTLNYAGLEDISHFLTNLILVLEEKTSLISYKNYPRTKHRSERNFKIYLGTIPDYTNTDITGVKLSGVAKNSPAEHAGVRSNDVIIKLSGKKIHDIYDYTFALNSLHVGKPVKLIVLRENKKMTLTITARYREAYA